MDDLGRELSWWWITPFAGFVLSIAVLPLAARRWYARHHNKIIVTLVFGVPTIVALVAKLGPNAVQEIGATAHDYVSFIVLLTALSTICGGVYLTGDLLGTPRTNATFLLVGAVLANFVGTTGAATILVRPLLRTNSTRLHTGHIFVFTTFVVCNLGGLLTPLGDPPLFLGFLDGVDFWWTLRLWPQWLLANGLVVLLFLAFDTWVYRHREPEIAKRLDVFEYTRLGLQGKLNIVFLVGVIVTVLFSTPLRKWGEAIHFPFLREALMLVFTGLSLRVGSQRGRRLNRFTWAPMREVAIVFAGIFATMVPALALLEARGASIGLSRPWHYFLATGGLSSFLDNAPTYLALTSAAQGFLGIDGDIGVLMSSTVSSTIGSPPAAFLAAISCGAVLMGANTYIGNAPNFLVKSMAEEAGVGMPSFFGYLGFSLAVLLPVFAVMTLVFFL